VPDETDDELEDARVEFGAAFELGAVVPLVDHAGSPEP
jgi:hypothetical protein